MTEQDIKEMAEVEIERFKLEAGNKLLESQGLVREAAQCAKNMEVMFDALKLQFEELSKKFSAVKKWLLGTNGNTVNEDDIHESFIVQFGEMKKDLKIVMNYIEKHRQPFYEKAWIWARTNPKTAIIAGIFVLNALGFSTAGIMNFLNKLSVLALEVEKAIPK